MLSSKIPSAGDTLEFQRQVWNEQAASIPGLRGGKDVWIELLVALLRSLEAQSVDDLAQRPALDESIFKPSRRRHGAPASVGTYPWADYANFLRGMKLAELDRGTLRLSSLGRQLLKDPTRLNIAGVVAKSSQLFSEALAFIAERDSTVEEVDKHLRARYELSWTSAGSIRSRMSWLEVLELIEGKASRKWGVTPDGVEFLNGVTLVSPEALAQREVTGSSLTMAPEVIRTRLQELHSNPTLQDARNTYNLWVPSPASHPNKVKNLRTIIESMIDPVPREDLLQFIAVTFGLRRSSVYSMMPFLRASGLIHEVGLGIYQATESAQAWVKTSDDVNFVRILHVNMKFVGEILSFAESGVPAKNVYAQGVLYGLNKEKCRWIINFLVDTNLLEKHKQGWLRSTSLGLEVLPELPILAVEQTSNSMGLDAGDDSSEVEDSSGRHVPRVQQIATDIVVNSTDPAAQRMGSGKALEASVREVFEALGYGAKLRSGSGDTDVLVQWRDIEGRIATAVVEAKARASGQISHTDVSDVALEAHKKKYSADFVAVVAPGFVGDTIRTTARARSWALIEASQLASILHDSVQLGLGPAETSLMFRVPDGLAMLDARIGRVKRQLEVVTLVVGQLVEEDDEDGEAISARDISRDGRRSSLAPTPEEVLEVFDAFRVVDPSSVLMLAKQNDAKYSTYRNGALSATAHRLRALARAIDDGIGDSIKN